MPSAASSSSGSKPSRLNPAAAKITASTLPSAPARFGSRHSRIGTTSSLMSFGCPVDHLHRPARLRYRPGRRRDRSSSRRPTSTSQSSRRDRDDLQIVCGRGRQVLEGVHRDINLISAQGIAYRADKDGATDLGELALIKITGRRNAYKVVSLPPAASAVATWLACARASADLRAPSRMAGSGGCRQPARHYGPTSGDITAATVCGSRAKSSRRAAA